MIVMDNNLLNFWFAYYSISIHVIQNNYAVNLFLLARLKGQADISTVSVL